LQETKSSHETLPAALTALEGYHSYFASAEKKGYSGVALYTRQKPKKIECSFGDKTFDTEGRILIADYDYFLLYNIYFPNGKRSAERLRFKMAFYDAFLEHANANKKRGKRIVMCGDVNTAHKEIDLARPKENSTISGFLPEERAWIDSLIASGYVDAFRLFNHEPEQYTWWDLKSRARERNVGWRIDYFFISEDMKKSVRSAFILSDVMGSDHCPVGIELAV
jgi:exodeoxyribonuclease-3